MTEKKIEGKAGIVRPIIVWYRMECIGKMTYKDLK